MKENLLRRIPQIFFESKARRIFIHRLTRFTQIFVKAKNRMNKKPRQIVVAAKPLLLERLSLSKPAKSNGARLARNHEKLGTVFQHLALSNQVFMLD